MEVGRSGFVFRVLPDRCLRSGAVHTGVILSSMGNGMWIYSIFQHDLQIVKSIIHRRKKLKLLKLLGLPRKRQKPSRTERRRCWNIGPTVKMRGKPIQKPVFQNSLTISIVTRRRNRPRHNSNSKITIQGGNIRSDSVPGGQVPSKLHVRIRISNNENRIFLTFYFYLLAGQSNCSQSHRF